MLGEPTPPEPRSIMDVLSLLRTILLPDSPFKLGLLHSFNEAQSNLLLARRKAGESLPIRHQQIFAYDTNSEAHSKLMRELFYQKVETIRLEKPVILLDVQKLVNEKARSGDQGNITYHDLIYSLSNSLASCASLNKKELYPIVEPNYISDNEKKLSIKINIPYDQTDTELAFIWGVTDSSGSEFSAFDSLMLLLSDGNFQRKTSVLIPETIVKAENHFGSPWVPKLTGDQLQELSTYEISRTISETRKALHSEHESQVRVVIRPFGSGKTKMLAELKGKLEQEGIPEVTFINGSQSLDEQKQAFDGNVIFVDEAVNLDVSQLVKQAKRGTIVVLFYPSSDAVKQKMPESQWPNNSYTIIK